jgi:hypothetical protein
VAPSLAGSAETGPIAARCPTATVPVAAGTETLLGANRSHPHERRRHHTVDGGVGTRPLRVQPKYQPGRSFARRRSAVKLCVELGNDVNSVNSDKETPLHGAAFRGLNEVIKILVDRGADINARDYRGRTAYRMAEGSKQSFQFQAYSETAAFIKSLGANTRLGVPGTVQERMRDIPAASRQQP